MHGFWFIVFLFALCWTIEDDIVYAGQAEQAEYEWFQEEEAPYFTKEDHLCGICEQVYRWSGYDIESKMEESPVMPCGCPWNALDRVAEKEQTMHERFSEAQHDLEEFFAWVIEAMEFHPLTPEAGRIIDLLVEVQQELKAREEGDKP